MKTTIFSSLYCGTLAAIFTLAIGAGAVHAQATRTWVSGVGDDANPASRTAPAKTFAGAISKTAAGGEINVLDPGGFGAVTITKAITIDGSPGNIAGVLVSGTNGIVVAAGSNDTVTLRNLDIDGVGTGLAGISIQTAAEVNIENCVIYEFTQRGVDIATSGGCRVNIKNCIIRNCVAGAVHAHPSSGGAVVTITNSHLNASLFGFRGENGVTATIESSDLCGNTNNGALAAPTSTACSLAINNCNISDNGAFGVVSVGALSTIRISNNTIFANVTGIASQTGGALISFGNNRIKGNTTDTSAAPTSTSGQQ